MLPRETVNLELDVVGVSVVWLPTTREEQEKDKQRQPDNQHFVFVARPGSAVNVA